MNFCPQCGTRFEPNARFCQECGFDRHSIVSRSEIIREPVIELPVNETQPVLPENHVTLLKTTEPSRSSSQPNTQPKQGIKSIKKTKKTRIWLWIVLISSAIGAVGWFGYNMYFSLDKKTPADIASNIIITENSKPQSLMDQELAKQKSKGENQNVPQKSANPDVEQSKDISESAVQSKVILEVGHTEEPKNKNPKNPTKLTIKNPTRITRITTDHYNDGMGTPRGGKITISDSDENVIGSFKAFGKTGKNKTPSAKWVAEPNIRLEKGIYFISDSEPETWSKTFLGGNGFVVVEGYEIE
jgi:hypothetical protein